MESVISGRTCVFMASFNLQWAAGLGRTRTGPGRRLYSMMLPLRACSRVCGWFALAVASSALAGDRRPDAVFSGRGLNLEFDKHLMPRVRLAYTSILQSVFIFFM